MVAAREVRPPEFGATQSEGRAPVHPSACIGCFGHMVAAREVRPPEFGATQSEGRAPVRPQNLQEVVRFAELSAVPFHERKHPVHLAPKEWRNASLVQFVTVCAKNRKPILANVDVHQALRDVWSDSTEWLVGRYMIMPDHVHLFCAPANANRCALKRWIHFWKSGATRMLSDVCKGPLWQASFWDRQLRSSDSYSGKWNYVRQNPVRAGLVKLEDNWPYQGEMSQFRFRGLK
jgi:putative transposase